MLRAFIRDSVVYGIATILVRGVAILLVPVYTRFLAPADYGAIDILGVFSSFVTVLASLEIVQAMARFYPDTRGPHERVQLASTALLFVLAAFTAFLVVAELSADPLAGWLLGSRADAAIVRVALLAIWANGVFYVAQSQLRWQLMATRFAVASIAYTLVSMGVAVALVAFAHAGVAGVFIGQLIGATVGCALSIGFARESYGPVFNLGQLRTMLRFSLPIVPSSIGVYVTLYIDRIVITAMLGLTNLGLFGIGYRLASVTTLLTLGVSSALTPLIYTHYREASMPADLARIFRYFTGLALLITFGLSLFAREALTIITTPAYVPGAVVVPLLTPALLLAGMYIFAPGLAIAKRTGIMAAVNVAGAVANTALNLALVPAIGIAGAASATLISQALVFGVQMIFSQRLYPVPHNWRRLGLAVVGVLIAYVLGSVIDLGWWPTIGAKLAIVGLVVAWLVWLGLVERGELARLSTLVGRRALERGAS